MNILVRNLSTGECQSCTVVEDGYSILSGESIIVGNNLNLNLYHLDPFKYEYRYNKIREKQKEIIKNYSYIMGLSVGSQKDDEQKTWIESVITFDEKYIDVVITDIVEFPSDPNGNQITINFTEQ